jgi:hypothetical protein
MPALDTARAAPALTERGPECTDRLPGAIDISLNTPPNSVPNADPDHTAYLLAELRCAALRARLVACEIDSIGVALRGGWLDAHEALAWLREECPDALHYVRPTPPRGDAP